MRVLKLEPPGEKEEDLGMIETMKNINDIKWSKVFVFGFDENEQMMMVHSAGSVYELLGMFEIAKHEFINDNED